MREFPNRLFFAIIGLWIACVFRAMSYHDALNYLAQKTLVIELYDQLGGRVAVCPEWNGRVLTSTNGGLEGDSFGYLNVQAIDTGRFEDFGGEDRWTLSPLIYSFSIESLKENKTVLQRTFRMADANGTPIEFHLLRSISLLNRQKIKTLFGDAVATSLEQNDVSVVGFRSENTVSSQERACVASRLRGMFNASPNRVVLFSAPSDQFVTQQFPMDIDYLGSAPHGRIRHIQQTLLVRADGRGQCQITVPFPASPPVFGAVELRFGTLTLWTFDLPNDSEDDTIRIYNSGHSHKEELDWSAYYEINCFSAAQELLPENSLTYFQSILHLNAENDVLDNLAQQIFGVSLEEISQKMLQ